MIRARIKVPVANPGNMLEQAVFKIAPAIGGTGEGAEGLQ